MHFYFKKRKSGAEFVFERVADGLKSNGENVTRLYNDPDIPSGCVQQRNGVRCIALKLRERESLRPLMNDKLIELGYEPL